MLGAEKSAESVSFSASSVTVDASSVMLGAVLFHIAGQVSQTFANYLNPTAEKQVVEASVSDLSEAISEINAMLNNVEAELMKTSAPENIKSWLMDAAAELRQSAGNNVFSAAQLAELKVDATELFNNVVSANSQVFVSSVFVPTVSSQVVPETVASLPFSNVQAQLSN